MSPELQIALATYVVPALITGYLVLRQRRLLLSSKAEATRAASRQSDWEAGADFRDELRRDNADLRCRLGRAERRVAVLERRVTLLTDLMVREGVPVPPWAKDEDHEETA